MVTEILCWTQTDRIPYSFAVCTILYSYIECVRVGRLPLCGSKASWMLCTGDMARHGKRAPRAVCCAAAPWHLSLHLISSYLPNRDYWTLTSPWQYRLRITPIFQLENVRRTEVTWFSPQLYGRSEVEAETEPILNSGARQYFFRLEYGHILKGRIGKYIKGKSSPC